MTEVQSALANLNLIKLESEVLWGKEMQLFMSMLEVDISSLHSDLEQYHQLYSYQTIDFAEVNAAIVEHLEKTYQSADVSRTTNTVKSIEKFLTPYLKL